MMRLARAALLVAACAATLLAVAVAANAGYLATGTGGTAIISPDGSNWMPQNAGALLLERGAGSPTEWMATASNLTTGAAGVAVSPTGQAPWTFHPIAGLGLNDVATDGTTWVALQNHCKILFSTDAGQTWSSAMPACNSWYLEGISYDATAGKFVVVGYGQQIWTSPAGLSGTWTNQVPSVSYLPTLLDVSYGGGQWTAVGLNGFVRTSASGAAPWTTNTIGGVQLLGVAYGGGTWVAVGFAGNAGQTVGVIATATNPAGTWNVGNYTGTTQLNGVAYDGVNWVAVGKGGVIIKTTTPSVITSWTPQVSGTTNDLFGVAYRLPPPLGCNPSTSTVYPTQLATLTATGGDPPYAWSAPSSTNPNQSGVTTFGTSYGIPPGPGTYTVTLQDSGIVQQTTTCTVIVQNPPPPTCSPNPTTLVQGSTQTFTAGSGTGSFTWAHPGATGSVSGNTLAATFPNTGPHTVTITDTNPPNLQASCSVQVNAPPPLACAPQTRLGGQPATFAATGGIAPFTWTSDGNPSSGTMPTYTTEYRMPGIHPITLKDSSPYPQTTTCTLTVPNLECSPASQETAGGVATSISALGGTPPYEWSAPSGSILTGTSPSFTTSFTSIGSHLVHLKDSSTTQQQAQCNVIIPPLSCSPAMQLAWLDEAASVLGHGGTPPYLWQAPTGNPSQGHGAAFTPSFATLGDHNVTIVDASIPAQISTCTLRVTARPLECAPTDPVSYSGVARFRATGGAPPLTWTAPEAQSTIANGRTLTARYEELGSYTVLVTDSGNPQQTATCTIRLQESKPYPDAPDKNPAQSRNMAPTAVFTATRECNQYTVRFDASPSHDADGMPVDWEWTFSDGQRAMGRIVEVTFEGPGLHVAKLSIRDDAGAHSVAVKPLVLSPCEAPIADFKATRIGNAPTECASLPGSIDCALPEAETEEDEAPASLTRIEAPPIPPGRQVLLGHAPAAPDAKAIQTSTEASHAGGAVLGAVLVAIPLAFLAVKLLKKTDQSGLETQA